MVRDIGHFTYSLVSGVAAHLILMILGFIGTVTLFGKIDVGIIHLVAAVVLPFFGAGAFIAYRRLRWPRIVSTISGGLALLIPQIVIAGYRDWNWSSIGSEYLVALVGIPFSLFGCIWVQIFRESTLTKIVATDTTSNERNAGYGIRINPAAIAAILISLVLIVSLQFNRTPIVTYASDEAVRDMTMGYYMGTREKYVYGWPVAFLSRIVTSETGDEYRTKIHLVPSLVNVFGWGTMVFLTFFAVNWFLESYRVHRARFSIAALFGIALAVAVCMGWNNYNYLVWIPEIIVSDRHPLEFVDQPGVWQRIVTHFHLFFATLGLFLLARAGLRRLAKRYLPDNNALDRSGDAS